MVARRMSPARMSPRARPTRQSGVLDSLVARLGFPICVVVLAACASVVPQPSGAPTASLASEAPSTGPSAPGDLPLDAASRQLLALLDPNEDAQVVVGTTWSAELARAARDAGMQVEI